MNERPDLTVLIDAGLVGFVALVAHEDHGWAKDPDGTLWCVPCRVILGQVVDS